MPNFDIVDSVIDGSTPEEKKFLEQFREELTVSTDPHLSKLLTGKALVILTKVCGFTLERAWRIVRPASKATGASARRLALKWIRHHLEKYPLGIMDALEVSGIRIQDLTDLVRDMLKATKYVWNAKLNRWIATDVPDWNVRDKAVARILKLVDLDKKVRTELTIGREEASKMHLETGRKFDSTKEWVEFMEGENEKIVAARAEAARDMKLIAEGRRIIKEEGQEAADKMKQVALERGAETH